MDRLLGVGPSEEEATAAADATADAVGGNKVMDAKSAPGLPRSQDQLVECCICLEELPPRDCIAPGVEAEEDGQKARGKQGPDTCLHWHCIECLRRYATVKVMDDRSPRVPCAQSHEGCPAVFPFENVERLLGIREKQVYLRLLAEASHATKVYCPFDGCTAVMDCADDEGGPDSLCAVCKRVFCRACLVAWHAGQSCAQYQSAKQDEPLHVLAKERNWKACPNPE